MSILDTFFILFESDASKLDKGLADSERKAKETTKAVEATDRAASNLGRSLGGVLRELGGMVLGGLAVAAVAAQFRAAVDQADKLGEAADRLGVAVEELGAWSDAVKLAGGSTEGLISSIERMNEGLTVLDVTGKSRVLPFLKELGIDMESAAHKGKTAFELFPEIADAMSQMDRAQAVSLGKKLGLDQGTIMLLMQGRREVDAAIARQKELGTVTKQQAEISAKFNDQLDNTAQAMRSLYLSVAQAVLPSLTAFFKGVEVIVQFMRRHSDFITGLFIAVAGAIGALVVPALVKMGVAAAVAFAPFFAIGAAIAAVGVAFALLYDDIVAWQAGADSLIGRHLMTWAEFLDVIETVANAIMHAFSSPQAFIESMIELIKRLAIGLLEFVGLMEPLEAAWDAVSAKVRAFVDLVASAVRLARGIAGAVVGLFSGGGATQPPAGLMEGRQALAQAAASPLASVTSSAINNRRGGDRNTSLSVGQVVVQTQATDADGISRSVGTALGSQLEQAAANYDDGVAA